MAPLQVVSAKEVLKRQRPDGSEVRITECIVGDATGVIIFTARNAQGARPSSSCALAW